AGADTAQKYGGNGLGLAICKRLLDLMGGTIKVTSKVGEGSTLSFVLPYQPAAVQVVSPRKAQITANENVRFLCSVLLVEDVETNRFVFAETLESLGCAVEEAENGAIAVEKLAKKNYDLVFMDVRMPVMDGLQATQVLRDKGSTATI